MSFIQQFFTSRDNNANAETFVGQEGRLWWDPVTNKIYSSDGETPGGIPLAGGGGGDPGGANAQVQFNNNGTFGGSANLTFNRVDGALTAVSFVGDGAGLSNITGANVVGEVTNATYASSAVTAVNAETVTANSQPNINSLGILTELSATGNVTGDYFIGNGSQLTGISGGLPLANGTSNFDIATADGVATITIGGTRTFTFGQGYLDVPKFGVYEEPGRIRGNGLQLRGDTNGGGSFTSVLLPNNDDAVGNAVTVGNDVGNVAIWTGGPTWTFDTNGELFLAGNIVGSSNTTIKTDNNDSWISQAAGQDGFSQLYWTSDITNADPYDGNDDFAWAYVDSGGFSVTSRTVEPARSYNWDFRGSDGTLITPGKFITPVGDTSAKFDFRVDGAGSGSDLEFGAGDAPGSQYFFASVQDPVGRSADFQLNAVDEGDINARIRTADGMGTTMQWEFTANGELMLPGDTAYISGDASRVSIYSDINNENAGITVVSGSSTNIFNEGVVNIETNSGDVLRQWQFDQTGNLIIPGSIVLPTSGSIMTTGYNNPGVLTANADSNWAYGFSSDDSVNYYTQVKFYGDNSATRGFKILDVNSANVWLFDGQGSLTAPGDIVTEGLISATGNIVTAGYFVGNFAGNITGNIVVPGSNTQVLFNTNGNVDAVGGLTYNKDANLLTVLGTISAHGNVQTNYFVGNGVYLSSIAGANVTGTVTDAGHATVADSANSVAGSNVSGTVASATTAGTVTTADQPNITSVGTLTSVTSSGNISGNYFIGNGSQLTGIASTYNDANVSAYLAGGTDTANIITTANVSGGNLVTSGNVSATGWLNAAGGVNVVATTQNILINQLTTSLVAIGGATGTGLMTFGLSSANQTVNIHNGATGTGNIKLLNLGTGGAAGSNTGITVGPSAGFGNVSFTANTILRVANTSGSALSVAGNVTGGNIITGGAITATGGFVGGTGTFSTITATTLIQTNPGINANISGNVNGGNLRTTGQVSATGNITSAANIAGGNLSVTGSINLGGLITAVGNITGGNIFTGANISAFSNVTGGNLISNGLITTTSNVIANYFVGNGAALYAVNGSNVTGTVANATYAVSAGSATTATTADTVTTAAQPNITSVGILSSVSVTGNTTSGNLVTLGNVAGPSSYNQPKFIQPNASDPNWAYGIYTDGASAFYMQTQFFGLNQTTRGFRVLEAEGNTVVFSVNGAGLVSAPGNVQGGNLLTGGLVSATGNVTGSNVITAGTMFINSGTGGQSELHLSDGVATSYVVGVGTGLNTWAGPGSLSLITSSSPGANIGFFVAQSERGRFTNTGLTVQGLTSATGNVTGGNLLTGGLVSATGNITSAGNIAGTYFIGNGSLLTGITTSSYGNSNVAAYLASGTNSSNISTTGNVTGSYILGNGSQLTAGLATYVTANAQANITSVGTLTVANISGEMQLGNFSGNRFRILQDSGALYIQGGNGIASSGASVIFAPWLNSLANATMVVDIPNRKVAIAKASPSVELDVAGAAAVSGNITGGNLRTGGLISATGNVTGNYILGNGSALTSIAGANVSGTVANATYATTAGSTTQLVNGSYSFVLNSDGTMVAPGGLINTGSNSVGFWSTNTVTSYWRSPTGGGAGLPFQSTIAMANTGVALTFLSGTANTLVAKSWTFGFNGNLTFPDATVQTTAFTGTATSATTAGTVTTAAQPNITSVGTLTSVTVSGNTTSGNLLTGGLISATGNVIGGNITTAGLVTATGNITGGNLQTAGLISATGNITSAANIAGGNIIGTHVGNLTGTTASLSGNVNGANLTSVNQVITGNGTVSTPGFRFAGDVDTGFFLLSDGNLAVTTNAGSRAIFFDSGLNVPGLISASGNVTGGNITTVGTVSATGATNSTAFAVGNSAVSNVALGFFPTAGIAAEMAIRDYSTVPGAMYFDVTAGNTNTNGSFQFRGSSTYTQWGKIDQYGLTLPTRPAFRVYGAGTTNISATTTLTSSNFAVDYNQGSYLNTGTGTFTAPAPGLYQVNLIARSANSASVSAILVRKTSGGVDTTQVYLEWGPTSSAYHFGGSTLVKMAVNDTLRLIVVSGTVTFDANDCWSVAFVG